MKEKKKRTDLKSGATTIRLNPKRRLKLENVAVSITNESGLIVRNTEVLNHILDTFNETKVKKDLIKKYSLARENLEKQAAIEELDKSED
ncbi:hypothetical protein QJU11_10085 [Pasteurella atlantica]|uniref:hypothetical protein n=1 Tax=Phocoenobacter atlanticus TaxID=3416742 RepID=UPI0027618482|nr:hypothetical protein [Pasteurella atlantica]MDP8042540.1 hypothetical protein [Pasteurella atlantica]